MALARQLIRQRDFSGGEAIEHAKRRDDEAVVRAAGRTLRNVHVLSTGAVEQRPGRRVLFQEDGRVDKVRMTADYSIYLCFGDGTLTIRDSTGAVVARAWGYDWTPTTVDDIRWAQYRDEIYICFPGQVPKIARWDGTTNWTFLDWAPTTTSAGRKMVPFYRFARAGITMALSALTGSVTVTLSDDYFVAGHVGTRFRYYDRQLTITSVASGLSATATVSELLREITSHDYTAVVTASFAIGDIVEYNNSGERGYVAEVGTPGTDDLTLIRLNANTTAAGDILVGPSGSATFSVSNGAVATGPAIAIWDEEVFNAAKGWPRSVSVDQNRLIFSDFPALPEGIAWSASGDPSDFNVGADPTDAIFEVAPNKARVYHVVEGSDEFVFTDRGIYYIPISESNPLRPGSVAFRRIPGSAASAVRPVSTPQGVAYVNNGLNRVLAIVGTGQTAQPHIIRPASDLHSHLFNAITCLAVYDGDGEPPDELVFVVNGDGTVTVGRFQPGKEWVGWVLWSGEGAVKWASAQGTDILFTTSYLTYRLCEQIDEAFYLDGAIAYDAIPAALGTGAQADVLLPNKQGTAIGDMTANGGLSAAFNGVTSANSAACAGKGTATASAVGKTFGQPFRIAKIEVWPSTDQGFTDQATVTISLRAKQGAAASNYAAEGTQLATTGSIADTLSMQTLTSNDETTEWDHAWVLLVGASGGYSVAELRFYSPGLTHPSGEIWFHKNDTVAVVDGLRDAGTLTVDANGELSSLTGINTEQIGHAFDLTIEPFTPHMQQGQSVQQTMKRRQISAGAVAVQNSTGFKVQAYNPNSAAWSTILNRSAYDPGEATTGQPVPREEVQTFQPPGNDFDPRIRIIKDSPGPLRVLEIGVEIDA